jgi:signal transduction histidine kinase
LTVNPKLTIHFTIKTNHLQCQITDNGKGFDSKKQLAQHSKGIQLVDERIQLLSGTTSKMIQIQPNSTSGTTIIMTIPMR